MSEARFLQERGRRKSDEAHHNTEKKKSRLYKMAARTTRARRSTGAPDDLQGERSVGQLLEEIPGLGTRHQAHGLSVDGDKFIAHQEAPVALGSAPSKDPLDD